MVRKNSLNRSLLFLPLLFLFGGLAGPGPLAEELTPAPGDHAGTGALIALDPGGEPAGPCPLEHTAVRAEISGFLARVNVTQVFRNPYDDKIEAVYTFPLRHDAAVDDMEMKVADRVVRGEIRRRGEARRIYDEARRAGHVASLLDQERPNIFTQYVANILPGARVEITIRYVEQLPYEAGAFTFAFPTVVGPRYIPDTGRVPDASRITPPVTPPGTRSGHDISIEVALDAGVPVGNITSELHEVEILRDGTGRGALVRLKDRVAIPNRDFVLTYEVAGDAIQSGYLAHRTGEEGYLTLILLPPKRVRPEQAAPREMIFVVDRSGSQSGLPIEKAKETLLHILDRMNPQDTFQLIDFSNRTHVLFDRPQPAGDTMRRVAEGYIRSLTARGGTEMAEAVREACAQPAEEHRLRIVTMMTDGYIGNDFEVLDLVRELRGESRWFPFGTGNSVNRFLLDNMARIGGGEADYVLLNSPGREVARKFWDRIAAPVLTDVEVDFGGLPVTDVFPAQVSDVWQERPLTIRARYTGPGEGWVTLRGYAGGRRYEKRLRVVLPAREASHAVLGSLWARSKVDHLMDQDLQGVQRGSIRSDLEEAIVQVALRHRIMTQYTSFVAVEETTITEGGEPRTVAVPVEMPEGVSYEGVFGAGRAQPVACKKGRRVTGVMAPSQKFSQDSAVEYMRLRPPQPGVRAELSDASPDEELDAAPRVPHLHPSLQALLDGKPTPEGVEVRNGRVTVKVWLEDVSAAVLKNLEAAGLRIVFQASTAKMVLGTIEVKKMKTLSRVDGVLLVEPGSLN